MTKPKIALTWFSSCGGCEESVLDLAEGLFELASRMDVVFWPIALDHKFEDVARLADQELLATLINGAIRTCEQEQLANLFRRKSQLLIAHGSCAHTGGVVGLGNLHSTAELLQTVYLDMPTVENPRSVIPGIDPDALPGEMVLTPLCHSVVPLNRVVPVDYYLPGCPPTPELVGRTLRMLLDGALPPLGSILADSKALCDTCPRRPTLVERIAIQRFKRLHEEEWDPEICFLTQHLVCMGPVTRGGCQARCINGNIPCRGCFGPLDGVADQGAKAVAFLAGLMDAEEGSQAARVVDTIPDLLGLVSQYALAASVLQRKEKGSG
ncbi:MAG TPA: oxidoreductase [Syntrophobacteraceae bacterium]|nr:oxidoreductase [Syntrophobacteraceae bacterium]